MQCSYAVSKLQQTAVMVLSSVTQSSHLQLLFAVEVVEKMMKVDLSHLLEQGQQTGHVLPLHDGRHAM